MIAGFIWGIFLVIILLILNFLFGLSLLTTETVFIVQFGVPLVIGILFWAKYTLKPMQEYRRKLAELKFTESQKLMGLIEFEGEWVALKEKEKIVSQREKNRERQTIEKEHKIQNLLSEGYTAVCRDCFHAYHRKSKESWKCPRCGSEDIENA